MTPEYANPFATLAELLRGLLQNLQAEAGLTEGVRPGAQLAPVLGAIAAMITRSERLKRATEELAYREPESYQAFQRAIGREPEPPEVSGE